MRISDGDAPPFAMDDNEDTPGTLVPIMEGGIENSDTPRFASTNYRSPWVESASTSASSVRSVSSRISEEEHAQLMGKLAEENRKDAGFQNRFAATLSKHEGKKVPAYSTQPEGLDFDTHMGTSDTATPSMSNTQGIKRKRGAEDDLEEELLRSVKHMRVISNRPNRSRNVRRDERPTGLGYQRAEDLPPTTYASSQAKQYGGSSAGQYLGSPQQTSKSGAKDETDSYRPSYRGNSNEMEWDGSNNYTRESNMGFRAAESYRPSRSEGRRNFDSYSDRPESYNEKGGERSYEKHRKPSRQSETMGELKNSKKHSDEPQYKDKYARDHSRSPSQERGRARGRR